MHESPGKSNAQTPTPDVEIKVAVDGKYYGVIVLPVGSSKSEVEAAALSNSDVKKALVGRPQHHKINIIPGPRIFNPPIRVVNIITRGNYVDDTGLFL